jgi:hypothetical protein
MSNMIINQRRNIIASITAAAAVIITAGEVWRVY